MKKKKDEDIFFLRVFNLKKMKEDKDYFILLILFLISLYGVYIQSIGFYGFDISKTRTMKALINIIIISSFLLYVLFCPKKFKEEK